MKKLAAFSCAVVLILVAAIVGQEKSDDGDSKPQSGVEVARLGPSNWDEFAPQGKEVDAIYDDFVLRNEYITAVIAEPLPSRHANMTVRDVAGALIDLTIKPQQSDQLSCFYPGARNYPFRSTVVAADKQTIALKKSQSRRGKSARVTVSAEATDSRPAVDVVYQLDEKSRYLTVTTKYTNKSSKPVKVALIDEVRADSGNEDMVKSPNGTDDLFWIHDEHWGQAYGLTAKEHQIQSNSNSRTSTLKYVGADGKSEVSIAAGETFNLERRVFPAANLVNVRAIARSIGNQKSNLCRLLFRDGSKAPIANARITFTKDGDEWGTAKSDVRGLLSVRLPSGNYVLSVRALGVTVAKDLKLSIASSGNFRPKFVNVSNYRPGSVEGRITDDAGTPLPCKVEFKPKDGTPQPDFGPNSAAYAVRNLYYAPHGKFTLSLPAGQYDVIISRGPEYDAIFTDLKVKPGETATLAGSLKRSVNTAGWVSSDFHSHSSPSGDNTGSQLGRVLNLVCENVEFAPCTEHNRISTYDGHITSLKIEDWISTVSGMELTGKPLPLNHQNTFPMIRKPHMQDGGGPVTDESPETQIERIALWDNRSEKLIQQNHPDIGWLFYDKDGDGKPDRGYERSFEHIQVMEIHPIPNALRLVPFETLPGRKGNNRIFNWLQLLNQGFRIVGVVNTDAHYNFHGSGGLRNWIQSSTDNPREIDAMEMVRASKRGRLIMSNGPFLEVKLTSPSTGKSITAGQDISAANGKVAVHARVQCPNWFDIDHVFVLVNGRVQTSHNYTREKNPDRFRSGTVKFDNTMELELKSDAHIIVVAGGEKSTLGPVFGDSWGKYQPSAMSNPMFVDVDGGGFQANKDTLGHPLPVKYIDKK